MIADLATAVIALGWVLMFGLLVVLAAIAGCALDDRRDGGRQ